MFSPSKVLWYATPRVLGNAAKSRRIHVTRNCDVDTTLVSSSSSESSPWFGYNDSALRRFTCRSASIGCDANNRYRQAIFASHRCCGSQTSSSSSANISSSSHFSQSESRFASHMEQQSYDDALFSNIKGARAPRSHHAGSSPSSSPNVCSTSAPSFLVYNVFTNRRVPADSPSVTSLAVLGIFPDPTTSLLDLSCPDNLIEFSRKLQAKETGPPKSWKGALHRQIIAKLMTSELPPQAALSQSADSNTEAVANGQQSGVYGASRLVNEVRSILKTLHSVARLREQRQHVSNVVTAPMQSEGEGSSNLQQQPISEDSSTTLMHDQLTEEQQKVVELACRGHHLYIGGGAGTGKTTMLRALKNKLQYELKLHVATTAVTGIAAVNIQGTTLHHRFGITREFQFLKKKELSKYDVIIIDEVSMVPLQLFVALDAALQKSNGCSLPFGGVQVILCGDFMQLSTIADFPIVGSSLFRQNFVMVKLQEVIRQSAFSLFARQLSEIRRGIAPHDLDETVSFLPKGTFVESAINLLPTNTEVVQANTKQLALLPGDEVNFPPLILPPSLRGRWSSTYLISVPTDVAMYDHKELLAFIEHHLFKASSAVSLMLLTNTFANGLASSSTSSAVPSSIKAISLYKIFGDAYALRVQFPPSLDEPDIAILQRQLETLNDSLKIFNNGLHKVVDTVDSGTGLHTPEVERALQHYASTAPMGSTLSLKLGARVLIRSNLSSQIVNGSVGTVVGFVPCDPASVSHHLLHSNRDVYLSAYINFLKLEHEQTEPVLPLVDFGNGMVEAIPPCSFDVGGHSDTNHYSTSIIALPLTLAYAFTVHKVQGLTLVGRVHLELTNMWPCDHLLYVAMSRVKNPEQLSVSGYSSALIQAAKECLLFDDSIPDVEHAEIPLLSMPATWKQYPGKRRELVAQKNSSRIERRRLLSERQLQATTSSETKNNA